MLFNKRTPRHYNEFLISILKVIELVSCSTHLSMKFILLKNVKMPTIVGILTCISMINTTQIMSFESDKKKISTFSYEQLQLDLVFSDILWISTLLVCCCI